MSQIKAVGLDLDGLIVDTESLYQMGSAQLLARYGHTPRQSVFDQMLGHTNDRALQILIDEFDLQLPLETVSAHSREIMREIFAEHLRVMDGVHELLDGIERSGKPKAIVTNSQRETATQVLNQVRLMDRFGWIVSSQDVPRGKPHPDIYLHAAARFDVQPAQMLVLEDSEPGCRAAVESGAVVIAVPNRHTQGGDFSGCRFIADDIRDPRILEWL